jgi:transposase
VEQWAEIRRLHFVKGLGIREIHRRTGLHRDTIRRAISSVGPPVYERAPAGSKLDAFKPEIHRLLAEDPKLPGVRVRELLEPLGCSASKTVVDDYLREVRPLFAPPPRTFQRTVYRPGEIVQFDVWEPRQEVPVGHGQTRRGWVVIACSGYSRAGAGDVGVQQGDAGPAGWHCRVPAAPRRSAGEPGLGSPGRHPRPRRSAVGGVRRVLWPAPGRVDLLRGS